VRKGRIIILVAAVFAVLALIWWTANVSATSVPDPVYGGLPLGYWLSPSLLPGSHGQFDFFKLVPSTDSNAVPYLVQALKAREGRMHRAYYHLLPHFPGWLKQRVPGRPPTPEVPPSLWYISLSPNFVFWFSSGGGILRTNAFNIGFGPPSRALLRPNACIFFGRPGRRCPVGNS
jgi:hypothetical protein